MLFGRRLGIDEPAGRRVHAVAGRIGFRRRAIRVKRIGQANIFIRDSGLLRFALRGFTATHDDA
ncbi:MAG TPA: hypothetical protein DIT99_24760 [Candidatus Latescibacteria bacterium]|nr:hypothetical protein [Candidatus Latescibacterota bacterium]